MERWESVVATDIFRALSFFFFCSRKLLPMDSHKELKTLFKEYELYFPECSLHLYKDIQIEGYDLYAKALNRKNRSHISIKTKEGVYFKVAVCVAGWHELGKSQFYPTFEALIDTLSPGFRHDFASKLSKKLEDLN